MKKLLSISFLFIILFLAFMFRFRGIIDNHSFWGDEALLSSYSRDIVLGKTDFFTGVMKIPYAPLQIASTLISFKLFGFSEFAARLPSILIGTIGVILAYLIAKKLSNTAGGLLGAFLYAFSTLNLSHSTQMKPYVWLQVLLLFIIYLITLLENKHKRKQKVLIHFLIILFSFISSLFHILGVFNFIPYFIYLLVNKKLRALIISAIILLVVLSAFVFFQPGFIYESFKNSWYNHYILLKNLLLRQYGVFLLPAGLNFFLLKPKEKNIALGLGIYGLIILFLWNFKQYSHNIRYLVPLFGIIFVFFGIFWGKLFERASQKFKINSFNIMPFLIIFLLIITQYKIYFPISDFRNFINFNSPIYFSPNRDFYGDVQIADYKTMYQLIRKLVPDYKNIAVFNDIIDAHRWYMPEKNIDVQFMKNANSLVSNLNIISNRKIYESLSDFIRIKDEYPKGILIVEDWESFLPEDIKQYAKKHMKRIIRVEGLKQTPKDPWPLEVYSWGID